ncbi:Hypp3020 [Branchiostoma lanceolatum]|uniref:Hypp3020 protein n=1 Tax=Branchiostoma lanceolatum TaxID=7740 RepID=A0A8J9ZVS7_BRALA|nr:Hypp3020 [Branchiostoma lanceolatum]
MDDMSSPVVGVLCAALLSACSGDAARPYRQFQAVTQTTTWQTTTPWPWTTTTSPPGCLANYAIGETIPGYINCPNCGNPHGGSPIPEGQFVEVNGEQCYCTSWMQNPPRPSIVCPSTAPWYYNVFPK